MKILIISPSLNAHGGIRVLVEWSNTMQRRGHEVVLQVENGPNSADWIEISEQVSVRPGPYWTPTDFDVAIAGTPFIAVRLDQIHAPNTKKFFLLQMAEDLFAPGNRGYVQTCHRSYGVDMPIIGISKWVEQHVRSWRGNKKMYYIGNGVSDHFKPDPKAKDKELTVTVEGWGGYPRNSNPAKDIEQLGCKAAAHLKKKYGARIVGFSQFDCWTHAGIVDEYYKKPSPKMWAYLMQRGTIMIKSSVYDARSCAPVEAMACGTVTARALKNGDDDLTHEYNCLRGSYNLDELISNAERLIEDEKLRKKLVKNGLEYRKKYLSWDYWMGEVEKIIEADEQ